MKKVCLLLSVMFLVTIEGLTQDKLIKIDGDELIVNVIETDQDYVKYRFPTETNVNTIHQKLVSKIIYQSGREFKISRPDQLKLVIGIPMFRDVVTTKNFNDVKDLNKVDDIKIEMKGYGSNSVEANIRLLKKASMYGGSIVLITSEVDRTDPKLFGYDCPKGCYFIEASVYNHFEQKSNQLQNFLLSDTLRLEYFNYFTTYGLLNIGSSSNSAKGEKYFFSPSGELFVNGLVAGKYLISDDKLTITYITTNKKGKEKLTIHNLKTSFITKDTIVLYDPSDGDMVTTYALKK